MRLRLTSPRASVVVAFTAVAVLGSAAPAWAQTEDLVKQPVIDSAPGVVRYSASPVISGHLENGTVGDEVALERQWPSSGEWKTIRTKGVDENGNVRFGLSDLLKTSEYRLTYQDPSGAPGATSDPVRIVVVPRLRLDAKPNHIMEGRGVTLVGRLLPAVPGRTVVLEQRVAGEWRKLARVGAGDGSFSLTYEPGKLGQRRVRVRFTGDAYNRAAQRGRHVWVYKRSLATWYGPGFYGNHTACGQRLTTETLGVAHRWLPCGTEVSILFNGRTITVPVIDRGPYTSADYDLTQETAERLGFTGTDTIGVVTNP